MKLTFAIALILGQLGTGVLLWMPLIPIREVRPSFFSFHSVLAGCCFALAAGVHGIELGSPWPAAGLVLAAVLCAAAFGAARMGRATQTRLWQALAAVAGLIFGVLLPVGASVSGVESATTGLLWLWLLQALVGTMLLGVAHDAMALGHWYLISRNLSFAHLIRLTRLLLGMLVGRGLLLGVSLWLLPQLAPAYGQLVLPRLMSPHADLLFLLMRCAWGLVLPLVLAGMAWRCAAGRANQAATGLLYLTEFSVLFGELFAARLQL